LVSFSVRVCFSYKIKLTKPIKEYASVMVQLFRKIEILERPSER